MHKYIWPNYATNDNRSKPSIHVFPSTSAMTGRHVRMLTCRKHDGDGGVGDTRNVQCLKSSLTLTDSSFLTLSIFQFGGPFLVLRILLSVWVFINFFSNYACIYMFCFSVSSVISYRLFVDFLPTTSMYILTYTIGGTSTP